MDTLFNTSYGDGSKDINHYVSDEVIECMNHNNENRIKMREIVLKKRNGEIDDNEFDSEIKKLYKQFK